MEQGYEHQLPLRCSIPTLKRPLPTLSQEILSSSTDHNPRKRQCTTDVLAKCPTATNSMHLSPLSSRIISQNIPDFRRSWSASPSQFCPESVSIPSTPGTEASSPAPSPTDVSSPGCTQLSDTTMEEAGGDIELGSDVGLTDPNPRILADDVCIGMILSQPIQLDARYFNSLDAKLAFPVYIGSKSTHATLPVCTNAQPSAPTLGYLDARTSQILEPLIKHALARIQSYVDLKHHKSEKSGAYRLCFNLYASDSMGGKLGKFLENSRIYLQHPLLPIPDIRYRNPHCLTKPGTTLTTTAYCQQYKSDQIEAASKRKESPTLIVSKLNTKEDFEKLLDTFGHQSHGSQRISQSPNIITKLLPHQIDGLSFMIQREVVRQFDSTTGESSCSLWKLENNQYRNIITGKALPSPPRESPGGLLADHMGLGKTLSILSLIVHTLPESTESNSSNYGTGARRTNATLVITKKSVLPQWDEQLRQHIKQGTLRSLIYYGDNRKANGIEDLQGHDVVFTTYETVYQDWVTGGKHIGTNMYTEGLHGVHWFRIVLDEGHDIRNRKTQKCSAISALTAERRWYVTGTPIHNSLTDMEAILQFLHIQPFDDYRTFNKYIHKPLKRGDPAALGKLRTLIDSFMLRRVKGTVELPSRDTYTKLVELELSERSLYEENLKQSKYLLDMAIETKERDVQAKSALDIILRLRLVCDHGLDLLPICNGSEDAQARELLIEDVTVESQFSDRVCADKKSTNTSYGALSLYQDVYHDDPQLRTPRINGIHSYDYDGDIAMSGWPLVSSLSMNVNYDIYLGRPNNLPVHAKFPYYKGPSSKVRALLDVLQNPKEDWRHPNGSIKSVVFSSWTKMLDLVSIAFDDHKIRYCRLDGTMSAAARNASLTKFKDDLNITVILVSLMAGGVGLNLTAASQVHLLEPHWNPMIEEQALDRVHRIGQRNNVQVFRYLVKDSFENTIIDLQRKKLGLARLGMEKLKKQDSRVEKLKELRALFQ